MRSGWARVVVCVGAVALATGPAAGAGAQFEREYTGSFTSSRTFDPARATVNSVQLTVSDDRLSGGFDVRFPVDDIGGSSLCVEFILDLGEGVEIDASQQVDANVTLDRTLSESCADPPQGRSRQVSELVAAVDEERISGALELDGSPVAFEATREGSGGGASTTTTTPGPPGDALDSILGGSQLSDDTIRRLMSESHCDIERCTNILQAIAEFTNGAASSITRPEVVEAIVAAAAVARLEAPDGALLCPTVLHLAPVLTKLAAAADRGEEGALVAFNRLLGLAVEIDQPGS